MIVNPLNNSVHSIFSNTGRTLLKLYMNNFKNGGSAWGYNSENRGVKIAWVNNSENDDCNLTLSDELKEKVNNYFEQKTHYDKKKTASSELSKDAKEKRDCIFVKTYCGINMRDKDCLDKVKNKTSNLLFSEEWKAEEQRRKTEPQHNTRELYSVFETDWGIEDYEEEEEDYDEEEEDYDEEEEEESEEERARKEAAEARRIELANKSERARQQQQQEAAEIERRRLEALGRQSTISNPPAKKPKPTWKGAVPFKTAWEDLTRRLKKTNLINNINKNKYKIYNISGEELGQLTCTPFDRDNPIEPKLLKKENKNQLILDVPEDAWIKKTEFCRDDPLFSMICGFV